MKVGRKRCIVCNMTSKPYDGRETKIGYLCRWCDAKQPKLFGRAF